MKHYQVKNFERFQHYKERRPPWVKLYGDLWSDRQFFRLKPDSKLFLIGLFTIASRTDNKIPDDVEWLAGQLHIPPKLIDFSPLVGCGFLIAEQDDSELLADRQQLASDLMPSCSVSISSLPLKSVSDPEPWPPEDLWLRDFIDNGQRAFTGTHNSFLLSHRFWDDVSEAVNGISPQFLNAEFAKMSIWLTCNPAKRPTPKGVRRFVSSWLQRAAEQERRNAPAVKTGAVR